MLKDESLNSQSSSARDSESSKPKHLIQDGVIHNQPVVASLGNDDNNVQSSQPVSTTSEEGSRSCSELPLHSEEDSRRSSQPLTPSGNDDRSSEPSLHGVCNETSSPILQQTYCGNDDDRSSSTYPVSPSSRKIPSGGGNAVGNNSISASLDGNTAASTESLPLSIGGSSPTTSLGGGGENLPPTILSNCESSSYLHCFSSPDGNTSPQISSVDNSPSFSRIGDPILGGLSAVPTFEDSDFFIQPEDVQLSEQIGVGAFSRVYVGMYMGELVAVKKQKWIGEKNKEVYLLRELAVLKHFEHPNLLRYIGASKVEGEVVEDVKEDDEDDDEEGESGSYVYIVTELAVHGDLLVLLMSDAPLGWCLRCNILMDTARALEFLHNRSLIHRDVKSANMILCDGYTCKLADFGMARQLGSDMTVVGTDAYMAPELMFDEPYDGGADMFSFGIVMWECIHRRKAGADGFAERRPNDKFHQDLASLVNTAPKDTPRSILMLTQQLCEYEPEGRPSAEDTFLWLEDLIHEMEPDKIKPPEPIDYMYIFQNGVTTMNSSFAHGRLASSTECNNSNVDSREGGVGAVQDDTSSSVTGYDSRMSLDQPPVELDPNTSVAESAANQEGGNDSWVVGPIQQQHSGFSVSNTAIREQQQCKLSPHDAVKKEEEVAVSTICQPLHYSTSLDVPSSPCSDDLKDEHLRKGYLVAAATELKRNSPSGVKGSTHMPITCRGFLFKKGKSGLRNWQKRWFVLEGSRLVWYKSIDGYPWEPRGFLELKGCFLARGLYFKLKILSVDSKADQEEYNRELAATCADDMEMWLRALQVAIDDADAVRDDSYDHPNKGSGGDGLPDAAVVRLNKPNSKHERILSHEASTFHYNLTVGGWLNELGVPELLPSFQKEGYTDVLLLMDLGLRDDDLDAIGIHDPHIRKALKMKMPGFKAVALTTRITGYFDFGKEIVYKVESQWLYNRASTFFTFQDFEEMHRKLRAATKEPKHQRLVPQFPAKHFAAGRGRKLGTIDHATTMARRQTSLNKYLQKLIYLVGFREPYFTIICAALKVSKGSV